MQRLAVLIVILFALAQNAFAQEIKDTQKIQNPIISNVRAVDKESYGIYASVCGVYNPGGVFVPLPDAVISPGGSTYYSESNAKKTPGAGGSGGFELISKENWIWYRVFSIGVSYYNYSATATQTATQIINASWGGTSTSQTTNNALFNYTMVDLSFRNYFRIIESKTQRLGVGIGATISGNIFNNTPEDATVNEDIPIMCLFLSGSLRYDIAIATDEMVTIEPYYNYEVRSVANTYPRLASFGLKLSLLFN